MALNDFLFTSESVGEGHPDKLADQVSDAILDALVAQDPMSRVACETLTTTGLIVVAGEITTKAQIDYREVARQAVRDIGYTDPTAGFDADSCGVMITIGRQSPDIAQGVNEGEGLYKEMGAGDQGLMFGFACTETPELMPAPIQLSHQLVKKLADVRKSGKVSFLRPDAKSQVTVQYEAGKPKRIDTVVVSTQHAPDASWDQVREAVMETCIKPTSPRRCATPRSHSTSSPPHTRSRAASSSPTPSSSSASTNPAA